MHLRIIVSNLLQNGASKDLKDCFITYMLCYMLCYNKIGPCNDVTFHVLYHVWFGFRLWSLIWVRSCLAALAPSVHMTGCLSPT